MSEYDYEKDPDVIAIKRNKKISSEFVPGKNPVTNVRPDLQYHDYENDPDIVSIAKVRNVPKEQDTSMYLPNWLKGGGEALLHTIASGASYPVGAAAGIYGTLTSGKFGTQEGIQAGEQLARQVQQRMQNAGTQPTTEEANAILEGLQSGFEASKIPPIFPEGLGLQRERQLATMAGKGAKAQLQAQFGNLVPKVKIEKAPSGLQSGGSAATIPENVLRGNIDSALANVSPEIKSHIESQPLEKINVPALETKSLEEKHGINLLTSQRTNDLSGYTQAWNHRSANGLMEDFQQQPKQLAQSIEQSKQRHAPRISSEADASELGQHEINGLIESDKIRQKNIENKYSTLKNSYNEIKKNLNLPESEDLPLNGTKFVEESRKNLDTEMYTEDARKSIDELLNKIDAKKGVITFKEFTTLDKRLSELSKFGKGSEKSAAAQIRKNLNNMELTEDAAPLHPLLTEAKAAAKERFDVIDSNPAYSKAIGEGKDLESASSQGESLNAAKFHRQFVSLATPEAIRRLKAELPEGHIGHEAIAFGELERAKRALTNANESRIKSDQFADFIRNNKSILRESLPPEAMQDIMEIGLLNSKIGKPEAGAFNYSNSWSAMMGDLAKQGLLNLGEAKLAGATAGASILPVKGMKVMFEKLNKDAFAQHQRNPLGGLTKE